MLMGPKYLCRTEVNKSSEEISNKKESLEALAKEAEARQEFWSKKIRGLEEEVQLWNQIMQTLVRVDRHGSTKDPNMSWQQFIAEGMEIEIPNLPLSLQSHPPVDFSTCLIEVTKVIGGLQEKLTKAKKTGESVENKAHSRIRTQAKKEESHKRKLQDFREDEGRGTIEKQKRLGCVCLG